MKTNFSDAGQILLGTAMVAGIGALAAGWVMNVMAIWALATSAAPITTMFIVRVVGVFVAPLGGVLGCL
jgi:hypothetical protein